MFKDLEELSTSSQEFQEPSKTLKNFCEPSETFQNSKEHPRSSKNLPGKWGPLITPKNLQKNFQYLPLISQHHGEPPRTSKHLTDTHRSFQNL
jgi:hypothetical protein